MLNYIVIAVLILIISGASYYVYSEKKKGAKCVGCPYSKDPGGCDCSE